MYIAINFIEAMNLHYEAGMAAIDRRIEYTRAYADAIQSADGKTAEVRKAQAEQATAFQLAELQRAELKERACKEVAAYYRALAGQPPVEKVAA